MKTLTSVLALAAALLTAPAFATTHKEAPDMKAATGGCESQAMDKKLAGAAKNSFMKKCAKDMGGDAMSACEMQAKDKKLAGAAKNSFVKKCTADAPKA